jgi:hypothetical protein
MRPHHGRTSVTLLVTLGLVLGVAATACIDPSATAGPRAGPVAPTGANGLYAEDAATIAIGSSSEDYEIPVQPPVSGNAAAINYCFQQLIANGSMIIADQTQRAVWDSAHAPHDTVFTGRFRAKAKYWAGTYSGQALRCIARDSLFAKRHPGPYMIPISQIEFDHDQLVDFCWGDNALNPIGASPNCYDNPAQINVFVKMRFGRNCDLWEFDISNSESFAQERTNGGLESDAMKWHVRFYAVSPAGQWGWWQVEDYGAQSSPYTNGWRSTGPPLYQPGRFQLCSRYKHDSQYTPGWYDNWWGQRGGWVRWLPPV